MRAVLDALEAMGTRWFITGSVAGSVYGVLRQTHDTDVVVDMAAHEFERLARRLDGGYAFAPPERFGDVELASVVEMATADKIDLILRPAGAYARSAMDRRRRAEVPGLGIRWVCAVEDLILAKLAWSEGTSELQLRDCAQLVRLNGGSIDQAYLERWAARLGLADRLRSLG